MENLATKREEIVKEAYTVFYRQGFQATCVDKVLKGSGISKRTLYKYFRSKEELIGATISYYQQLTFTKIAEELARRTSDPKEKILALFDLKKEALEAGDYTGCFAVNAKLEYDGKHPTIEGACSVFLDALKGFIVGLCKEAGYTNPETLATQIMVLFEGAIVYGQAKRDPSIVASAKSVVQKLL